MTPALRHICQVCYDYGPAGTVYGDLHYAESVQLALDRNTASAQKQFQFLAQKCAPPLAAWPLGGLQPVSAAPLLTLTRTENRYFNESFDFDGRA